MELYKTVMKEASATQIIEKSKFIAHVKPVETKEEADEFIAAIKKKYKDATHNVPALVLGDKFQIQWASDDGEPQGTSGAPMVQMMVKEGVTNLVVVVTRYFGGIKLGTGGLVRAYTSSARLGLEAAEVCSVEEVCCITAEIGYTYLSRVQQLNEKKFIIDDISYGANVTVVLQCSCEEAQEVEDFLINLTSNEVNIISTENKIKKVKKGC